MQAINNNVAINQGEISVYATAQSINGEKMPKGYRLSIKVSGRMKIKADAIILNAIKVKKQIYQDF